MASLSATKLIFAEGRDPTAFSHAVNTNRSTQTVNTIDNSAAILFNVPREWQNPPVKPITLVPAPMSDDMSGCLPPYLPRAIPKELLITSVPVQRHYIPYFM